MHTVYISFLIYHICITNLKKINLKQKNYFKFKTFILHEDLYAFAYAYTTRYTLKLFFDERFIQLSGDIRLQAGHRKRQSVGEGKLFHGRGGVGIGKIRRCNQPPYKR